MPDFKQRVPIATIEERNCILTVEAVKMLNALASSNSESAVTRAEFDALVAQVNTFQSLIDLLTEANLETQEQIKSLKSGFQS